MGIPILNELNQETDRLFIAGSRFSKGDVRIKKYIAPLAKMGEKAPVFLKLSEQLSGLVECEPEQSAKRLIEIKSLLTAVLSTQGDAGVIGELALFDNDTAIGETNRTYMELKPVFETLKNNGSNRLETIKEAYEKGIFNDPRTVEAVVEALGDRYYEMVSYLIDTVIPSMGAIACGYLYNSFKEDGKLADANKLKAIYKLENRGVLSKEALSKEALSFVENCLEKGSDTVKIAAIDLLSNHTEYQDLLIGLLSEKKAIREASMNGLAKMDEEKGIDSLMERFNGKDGKSDKMVQDALAAHSGIRLTQRLTSLAAQCYETVKNNLNDQEAIIKLYAVFDTLFDKKDENVAVLMDKVLTEHSLDGISDALSKEELTSLGDIYDKSLSILYSTTYGNDSIWELFIKSRQGLLDKLLNKKLKAISKSLPLYAFYIGLDRLDAEQYFDMFFKTDLFKDIYKLDRNAFMNILQSAANSKKAFSVRLADYFINRNDFYNAINVVSVQDKKSISALLHHFNEKMNNNVYASENYMILQFAGENKLPEFDKMYETYCSKSHGTIRERDALKQYLTTEKG